jgi:RNA polymerase sigma-70 factor (ECF subfamily)
VKGNALNVESTGGPAESLWARGVIEQNYRWLLAYAFAATGDENLCRDIVQETFKVAYQKRQEYQPSYSLGAWLRGIARNLIKREAEKRPRTARVMSLEVLERIEGGAAELEAAHVEEGYEETRLSALRTCLAALHEKVRDLLELRYGRNVSLKELAEKSGIGLSGVGMALNRARASVSQCVRKRLAPGLPQSET